MKQIHRVLNEVRAALERVGCRDRGLEIPPRLWFIVPNEEGPLHVELWARRKTVALRACSSPAARAELDTWTDVAPQNPLAAIRLLAWLARLRTVPRTMVAWDNLTLRDEPTKWTREAQCEAYYVADDK